LFVPGEVGRFKIYRVDPVAGTLPLEAEGCIPAEVAPTYRELAHLRTIPQVPCAAPPTAGAINDSFPATVSSQAAVQIDIRGGAPGPGWLAAFETPNPCAPDALAESFRAVGEEWRVNGRIDAAFTIEPEQHAGHFCAYLQAGGRLDGLPDGYVLATRFTSFRSLTVSAISDLRR
jgi:hypothetical protein